MKKLRYVLLLIMAIMAFFAARIIIGVYRLNLELERLKTEKLKIEIEKLKQENELIENR